jgi:hypothetical protein
LRECRSVRAKFLDGAASAERHRRVTANRALPEAACGPTPEAKTRKPPLIALAAPLTHSLHLSLNSCSRAVSGRPTTRDTCVEDNRNNEEELARWLEQRHGESYCIINLSSKNRNAIDYGKFRNAVEVSERGMREADVAVAALPML